MKIIALMFGLAVLQLAGAGEIADQYWREHKTNYVTTHEPFSGPTMPATTNGISEIGIERTPCFGSCPAYVCIIRNDGTVRYHGEAHVDRIGDWETTIAPYEFHQLANFIAESGDLQMQDTFTSSVTDGETVYTTFVMRGRRKVFSNYASSGPPKLWALQRLIDGLSAGATWRPTVIKSKPKG